MLGKSTDEQISTSSPDKTPLAAQLFNEEITEEFSSIPSPLKLTTAQAKDAASAFPENPSASPKTGTQEEQAFWDIQSTARKVIHRLNEAIDKYNHRDIDEIDLLEVIEAYEHKRMHIEDQLGEAAAAYNSAAPANRQIPEDLLLPDTPIDLESGQVPNHVEKLELPPELSETLLGSANERLETAKRKAADAIKTVNSSIKKYNKGEISKEKIVSILQTYDQEMLALEERYVLAAIEFNNSGIDSNHIQEELILPEPYPYNDLSHLNQLPDYLDSLAYPLELGIPRLSDPEPSAAEDI